MSSPDAAFDRLAELHALGVRLLLDDFGTGASSLARLRRLPVDTLKIDRSFITGLGEDGDDDAFVAAIASLAAALGLDTVAEGVRDAGAARASAAARRHQDPGLPVLPPGARRRARADLGHPDRRPVNAEGRRLVQAGAPQLLGERSGSARAPGAMVSR